MKGLSVVGYINDLVFYCLWRKENESGEKEKGRVKRVEAYALKSTEISFPSFIHWFQSPHPCMNLSLIINSFLLFEIDIFSSYSVIQTSWHCVTPMRPFKREWKEICLKLWSGEVGKSLVHSPFPYSNHL